ncbi:ABC transporter ATP-binding protein [Micromonospora sp. NBC_01813]|uniref:ABC transporter ATP-binding protein n=1 Tax=Micromonospora sp. NBC_01813 TaxID=2975988 RepID=UPI002DDAAD45|nr:ABC transporter ATP-binding protein [Micromonospora sp. NBC_01813]WSA10804.1 ABC transporter ATP-binding protein [Micromonospora sp. NBC_01813]
MKVEVRSVTVTVDGDRLIGDAGFVAEPGTVTGLVGPNGAGKTTLLRCVSRAVRPAAGTVSVGAEDVWRAGARSVGRRVAVVAQHTGGSVGWSAGETVEMGRYPYRGLLARGDGDTTIVRSALSAVGMAWAADRHVAQLSGGERQRVMLARALAQRAPVLLLDEPGSHLDVRARLELFDLVRGVGATTVVALGDLDDAVTHCDRLVMLHRGAVVAAGTPLEVLTAERVSEVFGVRCAIVPHPLTGRPHLVTAAVP